MTFRWTKYIRKEEREAYEALGWEIRDHLGQPHGEWSYLGVWTGEGEPKMPEKKSE